MKLGMKLSRDWHVILRRAWSIRLMLVAGLLSGAEAVLPLLYGALPLPPRLFAAVTFAVVAAAFVARILAQENHGD